MLTSTVIIIYLRIALSVLFQVGKCLQLAATFFGSFVVAFTKGWLLSLVLMASIPLIVIAGAAMSLIVFRSSNRGQKAYAEAGTVVEHTVGSIRTVPVVQEGMAAGVGIGCVVMIIFCNYGLAV
ncbi:hypothetical protein GW17_00038748, partial [Ensete ventricosum]